MLSYRHAYHAGNYADVLKHFVLTECVEYYTRKDKPFVYLDTHAGAGFYSLQGSASQKTQEYVDGVERLWVADDLPEALKPYLDLVREANRNTKALTFYPGSPWFAMQGLRRGDQAKLYELHSSDFPRLLENFKEDHRVSVENSDGFKGLNAQLPVAQKRAIVLIDPSYEIKADYDAVVKALQEGHKRMSGATFLLWYPVVERGRINALEKSLKNSDIRDVLLAELAVEPDTGARGMTASGMIVVNPPWTLKATLHDTLPWLAKRLSQSEGASYRLEQLVEE